MLENARLDALKEYLGVVDLANATVDELKEFFERDFMTLAEREINRKEEE
jgi:hypothetical protein